MTAARLRVLVVPKWYPWPEQPVLGAFCREHARALATRHDVVVLASLATPRPPFAAYRLEDADEDGLRTLRVRYRRPPRARPAAMGFQLAGVLAALRRLRREGWRPDVVHAHVYQAAPPALALGRLSRAPVVVTEHYTGFQRGLVTGYDRTLARRSFERADLVAPVSRDLERWLRELAPRARYEVVPNVVDTEVFAPADGAGARLPAEAGAILPGDASAAPVPAARATGAPRPARLLTVGALAEKKGHRYLLEALAALDPGVAALDVVGDGELRGELEARARALGVADRVRFHGELPKERVAELMRAADLFVLPSLDETFGCVLIEAMASGLPSVATSVGGVPEVLGAAEASARTDAGIGTGTAAGAGAGGAGREAGTLVPPADPAALAAAIRVALDGRARPDPGALAAHARQRYGYAAFAARWSEIYAELLASRAGTTRSATTARTAASE